MSAAVRVVHSGVGGEAVRSGGEEGSSQRGVSLAPLHGVRSRRGVQEDAAGENAQLHTCMSALRRSLDNGHIVRVTKRMFTTASSPFTGGDGVV